MYQTNSTTMHRRPTLTVTMFGCCALRRVLISRKDVIGKPSFSLSIFNFFNATMSPEMVKKNYIVVSEAPGNNIDTTSLRQHSNRSIDEYHINSELQPKIIHVLTLCKLKSHIK